MIVYQDDDLFGNQIIFTVKIAKTELAAMKRHYREEVEDRITSAIKAYTNVNGRPRKANWMWNRKKKWCCR